VNALSSQGLARFAFLRYATKSSCWSKTIMIPLVLFAFQGSSRYPASNSAPMAKLKIEPLFLQSFRIQRRATKFVDASTLFLSLE
jgi:hypothetical protein